MINNNKPPFDLNKSHAISKLDTFFHCLIKKWLVIAFEVVFVVNFPIGKERKILDKRIKIKKKIKKK